MKNIIPVVVCFDDNYLIPANVCIYSLLKSAEESTFYEVNVLYKEGRLSKESINKTQDTINGFRNCSIRFINIGNLFDKQYEVEDFTIENYFRLAIPEYFKEEEKVIYLDCDTIITSDLSRFIDVNFSGYSIVAVKDRLAQTNKNFQRYIKTNSLDPSRYFNSGVLIFNVKKINSEGGILRGNQELLKRSYRYVDQDMLNVGYINDVLLVSEEYNYTITGAEIDVLKMPKIIHFVYKKPWKHICPFNDLWWDYYRQLHLYDERFYLRYIQNQYKDIDKHIYIGRTLAKIGFYKLIVGIRSILYSLHLLSNK